jgi:hypothetical protein
MPLPATVIHAIFQANDYVITRPSALATAPRLP